MSVAVVVPTIREDCIRRWLGDWQSLLDAQIIVVEDGAEKSFDLDGVAHYAWSDIDAELGDDAWIIPRKTDCVRSFGYWKAWQAGAEVIITMDDDCYPVNPSYLDTHLNALQSTVESVAWVPTIDGPKPRGVPYFTRARQMDVVLNHGLWCGVPDLDAVTQLTDGRRPERKQQVIPYGQYFPMCGMNLAWRREVTPAMYFLLMGRGYRFDRFGDIWCGVMVKRITDHLGYAVMSGKPLVQHERASDVWANLRKEAAGMEVNERFWQAVDAVPLTGQTWKACYLEMAERLPFQGDYWDKLRQAMRTWAGLF